MKSGFSYRGFLSAGAAFGALIVGFGAQAADGADAVVDEVVVSATRAATPIEQLGDAISVLDAEQIELQQLMTLDDALERVPGVAITRSGGVGQNTQIRMRGFTTKHVLVMLDGVKVNNPSEADNQFGIDHLFLDNVERVEVLRGPQSGVYGADAVAGVINVVTKSPSGPMQVRGSVMGGSNDTYELRAGAQGGNDDFGLLSSVSYYHTNGISLASRAPGNVEDDGYENFTGQLRGEYRPTDDLELSAWVRYIKARNEIDSGYLSPANPEGLPGYLFQDSGGYTDNDQIFGAVKGVWSTLDGKLDHTVQVSVVNLNSTYVDPTSEQDSKGRTVEASYFGVFHIGENSTLLGGFEYRDEFGSFEQPVGYAYALVDDSINNKAVFAEANIEVLSGLFLSGAVRYDDNQKFGGETTFRTTAAYNFPDGFDIPGVDTKLRGSYGEGAEAPGLRQLLGSSSTYQGNPNLKPESSWMWDIGLDQQLENGLAGWSVTYYNGQADDGIFNVTDPITYISSPQNVTSPVDMEGVEVDLRVSPFDWLEARGSYTHMSVNLETSATQLFGRPKNEGSASLTLRPVTRLALTADGYWRDEFFSDYPSTYVMPGYSLYNFSVVWDFTARLQIAGNVHNIADKFYEEKLGDATYGRTFEIRLTATY